MLGRPNFFSVAEPISHYIPVAWERVHNNKPAPTHAGTHDSFKTENETKSSTTFWKLPPNPSKAIASLLEAFFMLPLAFCFLLFILYMDTWINIELNDRSLTEKLQRNRSELTGVLTFQSIAIKIHTLILIYRCLFDYLISNVLLACMHACVQRRDVDFVFVFFVFCVCLLPDTFLWALQRESSTFPCYLQWSFAMSSRCCKVIKGSANSRGRGTDGSEWPMLSALPEVLGWNIRVSWGAAMIPSYYLSR